MKRKNKSLGDLGKHVKISSSYFECIALRSYVNGEATKKAGNSTEIKASFEDSISNDESFSSSSIVDSEIHLCNIKTVKGSEVGKNLWGSIEALGVVSGRDVAVIEECYRSLSVMTRKE